jgi:hypothetical protein
MNTIEQKLNRPEQGRELNSSTVKRIEVLGKNFIDARPVEPHVDLLTGRTKNGDIFAELINNEKIVGRKLL